mgnify:FL=1
MNVRALLLSLMGCLFVFSAVAEEKIDSFDVSISVETDGDIEVT